MASLADIRKKGLVAARLVRARWVEARLGVRASLEAGDTSSSSVAQIASRETSRETSLIVFIALPSCADMVSGRESERSRAA